MLAELGERPAREESAAEAWKARHDQAIADREAWGCAGRRPATLDPDLAAEAAHAAGVMGVPVPDGCPFAEVVYASPWVVEITDALARATDAHIPVAESLGVDALSCVDLQAITEIQRAQSAAWRSDRAIAEQQRKPAPKDP